MSVAVAIFLLATAQAQSPSSPSSTPVTKLPEAERAKLAQEAVAVDAEMQAAFDEMAAATARLDARRGVSADGPDTMLNPKSAQAAFLKVTQGWVAYSFFDCQFEGSLAASGGESNVAQLRCHVANSRARVAELRKQLKSIATP